MNTTILIMVTLFVLAVVAVGLILYFLSNIKKRKFKNELDKLEIEKNKLSCCPITPELSKIEQMSGSGKLQEMYNNWESRLDVIKTNQIPQITDMLLDADYSLSQNDYKSALYKIAKLEIEIYKVRTNSDFLLNEIKEVTTSEERNRSVVTKLKSKYRDLIQTFEKDKNMFGEIAEPIELQFETIVKRFEDFEAVMESNQFLEVNNLVVVIGDLLNHMEIVINEIPNIILLCTEVLPKKITNVQKEYERMLNEGHSLEYLKIEYNIEESLKKINDIYDKCKVLNLEDSLLELRVISEYFDSVFSNYEKEKNDKNSFEEIDYKFNRKLKKEMKLIRELSYQMNDIKNLYKLSDENVSILENSSYDLEIIKKGYNELRLEVGSKEFCFSKVCVDLQNLMNKLLDLDVNVNSVLDSLVNMRDDEQRAREQLEEIKEILKDSKSKLKDYNLPVIPKTYFVELSEANNAIKEIIKELEDTPINIKILNTRVDTARDLSLKLYKTTKEMSKTAIFAELAIVYGNRYRSMDLDLNKYLTYAEKLFFKGDYQKSLEITINSLNRIEKGIYEKLLKLYSE